MHGVKLILTESFIVAVFWHLVVITIQALQIELVNFGLVWKGMKSLGGFFYLTSMTLATYSNRHDITSSLPSNPFQH